MKICIMMRIVYEWRRYYTSEKNHDTGKTYNLQVAAEKVNIWAKKNYNIEVYDSVVDPEEVHNIYNIKLSIPKNKYDCIIIAVPHKFIENNKKNILKHTKKSTIIFDITGKYRSIFLQHGFKYWSL